MSRWDARRAPSSPLDPRQRQGGGETRGVSRAQRRGVRGCGAEQQSGNPLYAFLTRGARTARWQVLPPVREARGSGPTEATVGPLDEVSRRTHRFRQGRTPRRVVRPERRFPAGLFPLRHAARPATPPARRAEQAKKTQPTAHTPNDIPGAHARAEAARGAEKRLDEDPDLAGVPRRSTGEVRAGPRGRRAARREAGTGRAEAGGRAQSAARGTRSASGGTVARGDGSPPRRRQGRAFLAGRGTAGRRDRGGGGGGGGARPDLGWGASRRRGTTRSRGFRK